MTLEQLVDLTWETFAVLRVIENNAGASVFGVRRADGKDAPVREINNEEWAQIQDDIRSVWLVENTTPYGTEGVFAIGQRTVGALISGKLAKPPQIQLRFGLTTWSVFDTRGHDQRLIVDTFHKRDAGHASTRWARQQVLVSRLRVVNDLADFDFDAFAAEQGWALHPHDLFAFEIDRDVHQETLRRIRQEQGDGAYDDVRNTLIEERCEETLRLPTLSVAERERLLRRVQQCRDYKAKVKRLEDIQAGVGQRAFDENAFVGRLAALEGALGQFDADGTPNNWENVADAIRGLLTIEPLDGRGVDTHFADADNFLRMIRESVLGWREEPTMPASRVVLGKLIDRAENIWSAERESEWHIGSERVRILLYESYDHTKRDILG